MRALNMHGINRMLESHVRSVGGGAMSQAQRAMDSHTSQTRPPSNHALDGTFSATC